MKITYSDHMGDDLKVVNMARVSFSKRSEWIDVEYTSQPDDFLGYTHKYTKKELSTADKSLIQFLARGCTSGDWDGIMHDIGKLYFDETDEGDAEIQAILNHVRRMPSHWAPFAHCQITLHMKVPMFVQRQLDKHQVGFTTSEVSRRYVTSESEFYVPDTWRKAADNVKQGSSDEVALKGSDAVNGYTAMQYAVDSNEYYRDLLNAGVCPEQARMVLPQSMYVESIKTGSLYGWANLYNQRSDPHAQKETRDVAEMVREIIEPLYPESWRALTA